MQPDDSFYINQDQVNDYKKEIKRVRKKLEKEFVVLESPDGFVVKKFK